MLQDELILVFQHAHRQAQLRHHSSLALVDPPSVRLVYRKHLLFVRNGFALNQAPIYLIYLPLRMLQVIPDLVMCYIALLQHPNAVLRTTDQLAAQIQIVFHLRYIVPPAVRTHCVKGPPQLIEPILALAPARNTVGFTRASSLPTNPPGSEANPPTVFSLPDDDRKPPPPR